MQRAQEAAAGPEAKGALPGNVRIREQEHWNVVVKKQIRRGKKGSQEPLAVEGWTGAFVLNPRKRHLKVDRGLVTVCGVPDVGEGKQATKKRGRGAQGKENATADDHSRLDAPPEWLLSALLQLKQAPVDVHSPVKSEPDLHSPSRVSPQAPLSQPTLPLSGEVKRRSFKPIAPAESPSPEQLAQAARSTTPQQATHPFNYSCKCSSCLTAMIPVPFQYGPR